MAALSARGRDNPIPVLGTHVTVIFETVHGSRAYGLATESSDTDLRGVFVPPPLSFTGYLEGPDQLEPSAERVLYEVRKFFRLAAACNPTVIEVLFTVCRGSPATASGSTDWLSSTGSGPIDDDSSHPLLEQAEALATGPSLTGPACSMSID